MRFGPFALSREGLAFGVISAVRLLVVFVASVLFLFTTLADDLLEALVARGVGHRLAFVVLSAVQLIPGMRARAGDDPRCAAGAWAGRVGVPPAPVGALVPLVGPVLLGSLTEVRERTFALEARGFGARPGGPPIGRWSIRPMIARCAGPCSAIALAIVVVSGSRCGIWG